MKFTISICLMLFSVCCISQNESSAKSKNKTEEIIDIVEELPRFPGCENLNLNRKELKQCSQTKMLTYVYDNLKYTKTVGTNINTTKAIVSFTVKKNGTIGNIKIARDPGYGLGQAAADVIHKMNTDNIVWIPGKQRGRIVAVQYNLPIKFDFSDK